MCDCGSDSTYGYLRTDATYRDFELTFELQQEADGNRGVCFWSTVDGVVIRGWPAEAARPGLLSGGIYESYGRGWLVQPATSPADPRQGEATSSAGAIEGSQVPTDLPRTGRFASGTTPHLTSGPSPAWVGTRPTLGEDPISAGSPRHLRIEHPTDPPAHLGPGKRFE